MRSRRYGFTLIELLVAIAIIALLAGLVIPVLAKVREMSRRTKCISNLRQIGAALTMYSDDYNGFIYPAVYNEGWKAEMGRYPPGSAWPLALARYTRDINVFQCPNDGVFPENMRFSWPDKDPAGIRVSYIYVGLNIWTGPGKPWMTERWSWYIRRVAAPDEDDHYADKGWVVRDKDWMSSRGGWVTVHDQGATSDDPFKTGSNVLHLDGSVRWYSYWDD